MTKTLLMLLAAKLPDDATEIIVKGRKSTEMFFSSPTGGPHATPSPTPAYYLPACRWVIKESS